MQATTPGRTEILIHGRMNERVGERYDPVAGCEALLQQMGGNRVLKGGQGIIDVG